MQQSTRNGKFFCFEFYRFENCLMAINIEIPPLWPRLSDGREIKDLNASTASSVCQFH